MIRNIFIIALGFLVSNYVCGQKQEKIKIPRAKSSLYTITKDTANVNFEIAERVALNLNMKKYNEKAFSTTFISKAGFLGVYSTIFISQSIKPAKNSYIKLYDKTINLKENEQVYFYGFTSILTEGKKADRNYSRLMMSAYMQELNPEYLINPDNFTTLAKLDKSKYWKRNWINMGYGISYVAKENPFMGAKGFAVGFFYVWEALHYIPIFGGPFFGETQEDKITIPIIGLTSLIVWKAMIGGICNKYLKMNKSIHDSGYKIPNNFEY